MNGLATWATSILMIANLSLFLYVGHLFYIEAISRRTFHGFKALFYFLLLVTAGISKQTPPPPPLLVLTILLFFLRDLYLYLEPFRALHEHS